MAIEALLPATIALALISFISTTYVILRTVLPLLPPHPLSRRSTALPPGGQWSQLPNLLEEQQKKKKGLKSAQRFQLWLGFADLAALFVLLGEVVTVVSADAGASPPRVGDPNSPPLIWFSTLVRPTFLLIVSLLSYINTLMGRRITLGKYDAWIWAPALCFIVLGTGLSSLSLSSSLSTSTSESGVYLALLLVHTLNISITSFTLGRLLLAVMRVKWGEERWKRWDMRVREEEEKQTVKRKSLRLAESLKKAEKNGGQYLPPMRQIGSGLSILSETEPGMASVPTSASGLSGMPASSAPSTTNLNPGTTPGYDRPRSTPLPLPSDQGRPSFSSLRTPGSSVRPILLPSSSTLNFVQPSSSAVNLTSAGPSTTSLDLLPSPRSITFLDIDPNPSGLATNHFVSSPNSFKTQFDLQSRGFGGAAREEEGLPRPSISGNSIMSNESGTTAPIGFGGFVYVKEKNVRQGEIRGMGTSEKVLVKGIGNGGGGGGGGASTGRKIELSRKETRVAVVRMGGHLLAALCQFAFALPFLISKLSNPNASPPPLIPSILLSLSILISGPLLAIQVALCDGLWFKHPPPMIWTSSSALHLENGYPSPADVVAYPTSRRSSVSANNGNFHHRNRSQSSLPAHSRAPSLSPSVLMQTAASSSSSLPGIRAGSIDAEEGRMGRLGRAMSMVKPHPKLQILPTDLNPEAREAERLALEKEREKERARRSLDGGTAGSRRGRSFSIGRRSRASLESYRSDHVGVGGRKRSMSVGTSVDDNDSQSGYGHGGTDGYTHEVETIEEDSREEREGTESSASMMESLMNELVSQQNLSIAKRNTGGAGISSTNYRPRSQSASSQTVALIQKFPVDASHKKSSSSPSSSPSGTHKTMSSEDFNAVLASGETKSLSATKGLPSSGRLTPIATEFGDLSRPTSPEYVPFSSATAPPSSRKPNFTIDYLSSQLLPRLVPSVKIGEGIEIGDERSPRPNPHEMEFGVFRAEPSSNGRRKSKNLRNLSLPALKVSTFNAFEKVRVGGKERGFEEWINLSRPNETRNSSVTSFQTAQQTPENLQPVPFVNGIKDSSPSVDAAQRHLRRRSWKGKTDGDEGRDSTMASSRLSVPLTNKTDSLSSTYDYLPTSMRAGTANSQESVAGERMSTTPSSGRLSNAPSYLSDAESAVDPSLNTPNRFDAVSPKKYAGRASLPRDRFRLSATQGVEEENSRADALGEDGDDEGADTIHSPGHYRAEEDPQSPFEGDGSYSADEEELEVLDDEMTSPLPEISSPTLKISSLPSIDQAMEEVEKEPRAPSVILRSAGRVASESESENDSSAAMKRFSQLSDTSLSSGTEPNSASALVKDFKPSNKRDSTFSAFSHSSQYSSISSITSAGFRNMLSTNRWHMSSEDPRVFQDENMSSDGGHASRPNSRASLKPLVLLGEKDFNNVTDFENSDLLDMPEKDKLARDEKRGLRRQSPLLPPYERPLSTSSIDNKADYGSESDASVGSVTSDFDPTVPRKRASLNRLSYVASDSPVRGLEPYEDDDRNSQTEQVSEMSSTRTDRRGKRSSARKSGIRRSEGEGGAGAGAGAGASAEGSNGRTGLSRMR